MGCLVPIEISFMTRSRVLWYRWMINLSLTYPWLTGSYRGSKALSMCLNPSLSILPTTYKVDVHHTIFSSGLGDLGMAGIPNWDRNLACKNAVNEDCLCLASVITPDHTADGAAEVCFSFGLWSTTRDWKVLWVQGVSFWYIIHEIFLTRLTIIYIRYIQWTALSIYVIIYEHLCIRIIQLSMICLVIFKSSQFA